jgi:hypothetical protein
LKKEEKRVWVHSLVLNFISGELINLQISKRNIYDAKLLKELVKGLKGCLIGDKFLLFKNIQRRINKK